MSNASSTGCAHSRARTSNNPVAPASVGSVATVPVSRQRK